MCGSSAGHARAAPGKHTGAGCASEHTAADAHHAGAAHIIEPVGLAVGDRLRRAQAAAHRRADALAQIASRESSRIAGDEGAVAAHDFDTAAQVVAVAGRLVAGAGSKASLERGREVRPVRPDVLPAALHALGDAAHPDVEPAVLLRHVPRVTGQSLLEEPQVTVAIPPVVLELVLQRDDLQLARSRVQVAEERTVHRTARAAGADQPAAAEGVVDDEARAVGGDATHVVLLERRARALEEPRVELEAADRVLHAGYRYLQPSPVHAQPRKSQQPVRVGLEVDLEIAHHLGRDPAGAELQAREALAVEHQDVRAGAPQPPGGARAGRPAADDEHVTRAHAPGS